MTKEDIDKYISKHLPYRLNSLMAWDIMVLRQLKHKGRFIGSQNPYADSLILEPAYEISLVFGRSLLNFIGVKYDKNGTWVTPKSTGDDVLLTTLFPSRSLCTESDPLLVSNQHAIRVLHKLANNRQRI